MKSFVLILVLCGALVCAWPVLQYPEDTTEIDTQLVSHSGEEDLDSDYLQGEPIPVSTSQFYNVSAEKIQQEQGYFGLDLDPLGDMKQPRCGFSDLEAYSFSLQQKIWDHTDLTYRILNYTPDMASTDVRTSIEAAFKTWSEVTPLTFKEVFGTSADITIAFADGSHGGNNYYDCPFNRYSTVLAHAVMLQKNISIHFNEDKTWTKSKEGKNLFLTAIHEIGHALGLSHSNNQNAIMYKFYSPTNVKLHPDDIERIQGIYGSRKDGPHQQSYQSPSGNVLAEWTSTKSCDEKINAVTTYEGKIYFFRENFIMVKDARNKVIAKLRLGEYSPTFFCGVDAAYEENGYLYYTYRNHYWKTLKFAIQGPPRTIEDFGFSKDVTKIDAAVYMEGQGQTLFFVGNQFYRYYSSFKYLTLPLKIADHFLGIKTRVNAAFQNNGRLYLMAGKFQYAYNSKTFVYLKKKKIKRLGC